MKNEDASIGGRAGPSGRACFGPFTLDFGARCLLRDGARVRLTPKPFDTLAFLVEHAHEPIEKERILRAVWKDTAVTDGVLTQAIREIRRALGDNDKEARYVLTVPRVGYRFVADVVAVHELKSAVDSGQPSRPERRFARPSIVVAATIAAAAIALLIVLSRAPFALGGTPLPARSPAPTRQLTVESLNALKPSYSPDGTRLLFVSSSVEPSRRMDLFVMSSAGGKPWRLTESIDVRGDLPVFTSDGANVAFSRYRDGTGGSRLKDLWTMPSVGGTPSLFLPEASGAGFSPDGKLVAYTKHTSGGNALWMGPIDRRSGHREIADVGFVPRWSPDGGRMAYTSSEANQGSLGHLWVVTGNQGQPVRLTTEPEQIYGLTWTPDSRAIVFGSTRGGQGAQLRMVRASGGPPVALTAGVGYYLNPSMSPEGALAFSYYSPTSALLVCSPVASTACRPVGSSEQSFGHLWPRLSPSGRRIASVFRSHEGHERLWITDVDTGTLLRTSDSLAYHPQWLDDDRVAFLSHAGADSGGSAVYVMSVSSDVTAKWVALGVKASGLAVHPSEQTIAFVAPASNAAQQIVVVDVSTGVRQVVATGRFYEELRWTSDGSMLGWSGPARGADDPSNGVWIFDRARGTSRQLVTDGYGPTWSAEGRAIYFTRTIRGGDPLELWRVDVSGGQPRLVRPSLPAHSYDIAGDRLVLAGYDAVGQIFEMRLTR